MKTTDLAMIFMAIVIPIVIVVYVDVSFLLKSEEKKLYYINVINAAIDDATNAMKKVEGEDIDIDYGYSGLAEKKVSVNANVAVEKFFESLYDNFEINGDKPNEEYLKSHVPAMAIVDYNGVYIYSMEAYETKKLANAEVYIEHILKPKRYFSYTYGILNNSIIPEDSLRGLTTEDYEKVKLHSVIFTMDDYIFYINEDGTKNGFYMEDNSNNQSLYKGAEAISDEVIRHLKMQRNATISEIVSEEMSYAVNAHNFHSNVEYEFYFPAFALEEWQQMVSDIGIIAFVQGINIGNEKLDYTAHGISGLKVTDRYYVSRTRTAQELSYYHITKECSMYEAQSKPITGYYLSLIDAASLGYYPCPVCSP